MVSTSVSGGSTSFPPPGTALSAHHEIQLLREQLEQQSQQTQAALAQLQLAREQLAAEQVGLIKKFPFFGFLFLFYPQRVPEWKLKPELTSF